MPEYTVLAAVSVCVVLALEWHWRTGLFRTARYWLSMAIVGFFQILVDGWLTKLDAPIVLYAPQHHLGVRVPWDIPIEDFLFGFSMVTLTILLWVRAGSRHATETHTESRAAARAQRRALARTRTENHATHRSAPGATGTITPTRPLDEEPS
ncbi:lycopene cyclase domain-containing protein [Mobilicoccus pelagius]|uniref:Lycopene cyclase n=1 Tax=Mobilicoccus pelagius NBRC 104925 TaxID=1089455 RepID=H5UVM0_9MICO|nr:lycopene cyclase domain-containing protein [Mobilicoccus pelagius]GAB49778.1 lycopene cyclase [Mobilicoccus pelagius NBRC 104925]